MEYFDPKTNKFPYPMDTDKHYLVVKKNDGTVFDKNYPYVDKSKKFLRRQKWFRAIMITLGFPVSRIRMGIKVVGKENLKKYKDVLDNGVVSVCNHVHMWDYLSIMSVMHPRKLNVLSWAPDVSGENGKLIRNAGGIPVPENNIRATGAFVNSVLKLLEDKGWVHIYAEGSMWEYYAPIRPFKLGAAYFAIKANKPILPLAYSFRKPNWFRKIFGQIATFTLHIGEPLYAKEGLDFQDAQIELTTRAHDEVCKLAGIDPKENIYKPVFSGDKRIDYYTSTYGVKYKGSW